MVNTWGIYSPLEEAFEFCWSSFANEHNTLPKSTRRNVKLNKFAFGTAWLPELSCKHWFKSSVWNLCRWVADVPPRETTLRGNERGEINVCRSQAGVFHIIGTFAIRYVSQDNLGDGGGGSRTKVTGIIVVFFGERNCGFWSDLGCVQDGKPETH